MNEPFVDLILSITNSQKCACLAFSTSTFKFVMSPFVEIKCCIVASSDVKFVMSPFVASSVPVLTEFE